MATEGRLADVTIACCAKDEQSTLSDTLKSITPSVLAGAKVVLVDDGSSDGTSGIMEDFAQRHRCVKILANDEAKGPGTSRNAALSVAESRYISFIDADDWVTKDFYLRLRQAFDRFDGVDFVRSHHVKAEGSRRELGEAPISITEHPFAPRDQILPVDQRTMVDYPSPWAGMYNIDVWRRNKIRFPDLFSAEDRVPLWEMHLRCKSAVVLQEFGYFYRRGNSSRLTQTGDARQLDFLSAQQEILNIVAEEGSKDHYRKAVRQTMALICFHVEKERRLEERVRQELHAGIRKIVSEIREDAMTSELNSIDKRRKDLILGVLGG